MVMDQVKDRIEFNKVWCGNIIRKVTREEDIILEQVIRLGKYISNSPKPRPILIKFKTIVEKNQVLSQAKKLKQDNEETYIKVFF